VVENCEKRAKGTAKALQRKQVKAQDKSNAHLNIWGKETFEGCVVEMKEWKIRDRRLWRGGKEPMYQEGINKDFDRLVGLLEPTEEFLPGNRNHT